MKCIVSLLLLCVITGVVHPGQKTVELKMQERLNYLTSKIEVINSSIKAIEQKLKLKVKNLSCENSSDLEKLERLSKKIEELTYAQQLLIIEHIALLRNSTTRFSEKNKINKEKIMKLQNFENNAKRTLRTYEDRINNKEKYFAENVKTGFWLSQGIISF